MERVIGFLTGSRKYGTPTQESDIDVVCRVNQSLCSVLWTNSPCEDKVITNLYLFYDAHTLQVLVRRNNANRVTLQIDFSLLDDANVIRQCKPGSVLNLIPVVCDERYKIWQRGTIQLAARKTPVTRDEAIEHFTSIGMPRFNS